MIRYHSIPDGVVAPIWTENKQLDQSVKDKIKWSGSFPIPRVGTHVKVTVNNIGDGHIIGYFTEYGWLGVMVQLNPKTRAKWHKKQNPDTDLALPFGMEIEIREVTHEH